MASFADRWLAVVPDDAVVAFEFAFLRLLREGENVIQAITG